jgi:hypothetical protein
MIVDLDLKPLKLQDDEKGDEVDTDTDDDLGLDDEELKEEEEEDLGDENEIE